MNDYEKHKAFKDDLLTQDKGSLKEILFNIIGMITLGFIALSVIIWLLGTFLMWAAS